MHRDFHVCLYKMNEYLMKGYKIIKLANKLIKVLVSASRAVN